MSASGIILGFGVLLLVLERVGVSATVLWTAFTGFATVGAVAVGLLCWWGLIHLVSFIVSLFK